MREDDRELLERAALAMGIEGRYFESENPIHTGIYRAEHESYWNPLMSDSEALRLVVKLKLHVGLEDATVSVWHKDRFGNFQTEILGHRGDEAATRRAIVRAAAATVRRNPITGTAGAHPMTDRQMLEDAAKPKAPEYKRAHPDTANPCAICGWGPHMGVHRPIISGERKGQPWGHAWQARPARAITRAAASIGAKMRAES